MLSCKQLVEKSDKILAEEPATLGEKMGVWLHLMMCRHCRNYLKQKQTMVAVAKNLTLEKPENELVKNNVAEMRTFSENNKKDKK